jgi:hypothetical protein
LAKLWLNKDLYSELNEVAFDFPAAIRKIDSSAFVGRSHLPSFTVPSSVSTLEDSVFSSCSELTTVIFEAPSNLTDIPNRLFSRCGLLTIGNLPDSVTRVAGPAFLGSGVTSLTVPGYNCSLSCKPSTIKSPASVREVGAEAFSEVDSIVDLSFEEGVEYIGMEAFFCCFSGVSRCH